MPAEKGAFLGECGRTACKTLSASWWNVSTERYYCGSCARRINEANGKEICRSCTPIDPWKIMPPR